MSATYKDYLPAAFWECQMEELCQAFDQLLLQGARPSYKIPNYATIFAQNREQIRNVWLENMYTKMYLKRTH